MPWWVILFLYAAIIAALAGVVVFIFRHAADGGLVRRKGVHAAARPKPLISPLSQRAHTTLRARVAGQYKTALVPRQAGPVDEPSPETVPADD